MAKKKPVTEQILEEKQAQIAEAVKILTKGVSVKLSMEDHYLLTLVADLLNEKKGKFASELLARSVQELADNMDLGEFDNKTGEFVLYEPKTVQKRKK